MATYSIDIGFNRNNLRHPATSLAALLSQGVTEVFEVGNPVYTARSFRTGDRLLLTAYDLTQGEPGEPEPPKVSAMSIELFFSLAAPAVTNPPPNSPISGGPEFPNFKICPYQDKNGQDTAYSTVFEVTAPAWLIELDTTASKAFPTSQLEASSKSSRGAGLDLVNAGHFYYTILLSVTWADDPTNPKLFRVDPEMITTNHPGGVECKK